MVGINPVILAFLLPSQVKKTFKLDAQLEANVEIPLLQLLVSTVSKSNHFSIIRTPLAKKYPSSVSAQLFLHLYHFTHGIHPHYHYYDCIVHPRLSRLVRLIFDPRSPLQLFLPAAAARKSHCLIFSSYS